MQRASQTPPLTEELGSAKIGLAFSNVIQVGAARAACVDVCVYGGMGDGEVWVWVWVCVYVWGGGGGGSVAKCTTFADGHNQHTLHSPLPLVKGFAPPVLSQGHVTAQPRAHRTVPVWHRGAT